MGEKKFTFLELHVDGDTQFGPKSINDALPIGDDADADEKFQEDDDEAAAAEDDSGGKGAIGVVVALVVLVGLAVAVKKFRGGDDESELDQPEEPDVIVN